MRRLFQCGLFFLMGCQGFTGPFAPRRERPDNPCYTIPEQQRRARAGTALPDDTYLGGPESGLSPPGAFPHR